MGVEDPFVNLLLSIIESHYGNYQESNRYLEFGADPNHQTLANMVHAANEFMLDENHNACGVFFNQFKNNVNYVSNVTSDTVRSVKYIVKAGTISIEIGGCHH
jgi:F0F1-type ATP synthase gamma subunit